MGSAKASHKCHGRAVPILHPQKSVGTAELMRISVPVLECRTAVVMKIVTRPKEGRLKLHQVSEWKMISVGPLLMSLCLFDV